MKTTENGLEHARPSKTKRRSFRRVRLLSVLVAFLLVLAPLPGSSVAGANNTSPSDCSRGAVHTWSVQYGRSWVQTGLVQTYDFRCGQSKNTQRWAGLFSQARNGGILGNHWTSHGADWAKGSGSQGTAQVAHRSNCGVLYYVCKTYLGVHYEVVGHGPPSPYPFAFGYAPQINVG